MFQLLLGMLFVHGINAVSVDDRYCYPGQSCYPTMDDLIELAFQLSRPDVLRAPDSPSYATDTLMKNRLFTRYPSVVLMAQDKYDVQKGIKFARKHNLKVSIMSSGHDYLGRSSWDGCFLICLKEIQDIDIDLFDPRHPDGVATVGTGNPWRRIYYELHQHNRVVVGGSHHNVTPGGYTQGGGHSPIGRNFGLAVDQLLQMEVETANGTLVNCTANETYIEREDGSVYSTADGDLFWALKGGGGGTFGVVMSYTFKIHRQPSQLVKISFSFPLKLTLNGTSQSIPGTDDPEVGTTVFRYLSEMLQSLPKEYGGYISLTSLNYPVDESKPDDYVVHGTFSLLLIKFGPYDAEVDEILANFMSIPTDLRGYWHVENKTSFWDYEKDIVDNEDVRLYMMGTFIQPENLNEETWNFFMEKMTRKNDDTFYTCTGILIGGKMSDFPAESSPIHPGFRSGIVCMSCVVAVGVADFQGSSALWAEGANFSASLREHGHGVYLNEPAYDDPLWRENFWGADKYKRLLAIKKKWDPDNFLTCYHCVGSEASEWDQVETTTVDPCRETSSASSHHPIYIHLYNIIIITILYSLKEYAS